MKNGNWIKRICFVLLLFASLGARAQQLKMPEVPKGNTKGCTINGNYTPVGAFQKNFPNFLNDGKYDFDSETIIKGKGLDDECFYGDYEKLLKFDNLQYPARAFETNGDLSKFGKLRVKLCTSLETGAKFHLDDKNYIRTNFELQYQKAYELNDNANAAYAKTNEFYKNSLGNYLRSKKANAIVFSELGTTVNADTIISEDEIILQFEYIQSSVWLQKATAERFPSYSLYKLLIKNTDGDTLKTYGQAVFFDANHSKFSRPKLTEHLVFATTFGPAVANLINQFIADEPLKQKIYAEHEAKLKKMKASSYYAGLVALKNKYCALQDRKNMLNIILADIGFKQDMLNAGIQGSQQGLTDMSTLNGNSGGSMLAGLITGMITKSSEKKQLEKTKSITGFAKKELNDIMAKEDLFIKDISASLLYPSDFFALLKNKDKATVQLKHILDNILESSTNIDYNLNATYKSLNNTYINGLANSFQAAMQSPVASAISNGPSVANGGHAAPNADCSKQSEAEWKATQEYAKCKNQTMVNTSQASCERAKAKLIEITLKNCRSKLPPNEIKALEQTRQQLLQRAAQMDSGAFRMN